ncbi:hypothetical protein [Ferrimonas marina]|uniref:Uncharacterized protein n=1 Tax=Ferrimonas marina TaxID=299255 RepID=A0A1M5ZFS0_9GAMM|nr:hypothetical protein [Ferrimonas marina]SHI23115.1 hypothetical protein SAMN02745129_0252 [Ferrimonas marina]
MKINSSRQLPGFTLFELFYAKQQCGNRALVFVGTAQSRSALGRAPWPTHLELEQEDGDRLQLALVPVRLDEHKMGFKLSQQHHEQLLVELQKRSKVAVDIAGIRWFLGSRRLVQLCTWERQEPKQFAQLGQPAMRRQDQPDARRWSAHR